MVDTAIIGGIVPDFDKGAMIAASIGIADGRICAVVPAADADGTRLLQNGAGEVIDAGGDVVAPGFIDIHMHEEDLSETDEFGIGRLMARMGVTTGIAGNCGQSPQTISEFSSWVREKGGAPINYVLLAGYNDYRHKQGLGEYDAADPAQMRRTQEYVRSEVECGCWGVSFGLEYDPGISSEEMLAMVEAVRGFNPFVSVHFRADCDRALESLQEMATLSREAGVRVEVSHLSSLAGYGYMDQALGFIEKEMGENPLFGYDTYPYTAFGTTIGSAVFDVDWRSKWGCGYDAIQFLYPPYKGMRATKETYEQVRSEHPEQNVVCFAMRQEEIDQAIENPLGLVCSDGGVYEGECHPRAAGTFPRIIARYVRELGALTLVDALEKISLKPAGRIGLAASKGSVEVGKDADLVIFDPDRIADASTFDDPTVAPVGIDRVMVGGVSVVAGGADTGALPGSVLVRS
jgi:N-acyl-D-amino-acid deacylase